MQVFEVAKRRLQLHIDRTCFLKPYEQRSQCAISRAFWESANLLFKQTPNNRLKSTAEMKSCCSRKLKSNASCSRLKVGGGVRYLLS